MKRVNIAILIMAVLCLAFSTGICEGNIALSGSLSGEISYPDEQHPKLIYTYSYPCFEENNDTAAMINSFYQYLVDDAIGFTIPVTADMLGDDIQGGTAAITVSGSITCSNGMYVSVCVRTDSSVGAGTSVVYAGHTFPLSGEKAGECINLPYLLGQLTADNTDEWLEDRQTEKVNSCVRELVWEVIEDQWASGTVNFFDGTTRETLDESFFPDEDFYLDESGNPVFFIQEGILAPVSDGALLYPFTMEELIDEI